MGTKCHTSNLDLYLTSVILYEVGSIIRIQLASQYVGNAVRIVGVFLLFYTIIFQLLSKGVPKLNVWASILLSLNTFYILFSCVTSGLDLTRFFGEGTYMLNYMLPYILLFNPTTINLRRVFRFCLVFCCVSVIMLTLNAGALSHIGNAEYVQSVLEKNPRLNFLAQLPVMWSIPASLIYMSPFYFSRRDISISILVAIISMGFALYFGRRSVSIYGALLLASAYIMYLRSDASNFKQKYFSVFCFIVIMPILFIGATEMFSYAWHRGLTDSRTGVEVAFYADMSTLDLLFGRGLNGTYYDASFVFMDAAVRPGIETGYLNIILHAGGIYLVFYLMMIATIVYNAIKKTRNTLIRAFAVYIALNTIYLVFGSYPDFNLRFFCFWIGIIMCSNPRLVQLSDREIYACYFLRK